MGSETSFGIVTEEMPEKANESSVSDFTKEDIKNSSGINEGEDVEAENTFILETYSKRKVKKRENVLKAAEKEATRWGRDVISEVDYPIEWNFLYKLYDTCDWDQSRFQATDLLPSLVQVVAIAFNFAHCIKYVIFSEYL